MKNILKTFKYFCLLIFFIINTYTIAFAERYTITNGIDFNARVKSKINPNFTAASIDTTIRGFKFVTKMPNYEVILIDISEDHDNSVLAYIRDGIIYCISDDDVYLNPDCSYMFDKFVNLKSVDFKDMILSKVKKTNFMFSNCKYLNKLNMDTDDTMYLTEMESMFFDCETLKDLDLFMIDTHSVSNMRALFYNCRNLRNIFINTYLFSTRNLSNVDYMYGNCLNLKTNLGRNVVLMEPSEYKTLTRAGNEEIEGILRDFDFEYDNYFKSDPEMPIDRIEDKVITSYFSNNKQADMSAVFMNNARNNSSGYLDVDSPLYNHRSGKGDLGGLSPELINQTVSELPFATSENSPVIIRETVPMYSDPMIETSIVFGPEIVSKPIVVLEAGDGGGTNIKSDVNRESVNGETLMMSNPNSSNIDESDNINEPNTNILDNANIVGSEIVTEEIDLTDIENEETIIDGGNEEISKTKGQIFEIEGMEAVFESSGKYGGKILLISIIIVIIILLLIGFINRLLKNNKDKDELKKFKS